MGARRDNITGMERTQIAIDVLPSYRPHGLVTELAQSHQVSRQTIYDIAAAGKAVLEAGLQPGRHGPALIEKSVRVDRNRLERSTVVLTEAGVSQRDIGFCLEEMLDTSLPAAWVNAELSQREAQVAAVNVSWHPSVTESCLEMRFTRMAARTYWWWATRVCISMP